MAIDFRSFSDNPAVTQEVSNNKRWWTLTQEEMYPAITGTIDFLQTHQSVRQNQMLMSARLYGNISMVGLNGITTSRNNGGSSIRDRVTYNICQAVVDTVSSKMAKNKPKPLFLTDGGDYKKQRRAKKLNQFVDGVFYENDAYELGNQVFRDACVFGTGIVHCFTHYGRVKFERVLASEIFVDEEEGYYGKPRQMHRVKNIDRQVLAELFPNKKRIISECATPVINLNGGYENISDVITVRESFHLPSGPDAKDGIHVISIGNGILFTEEWTRDSFPFAFFHWSKRLYGFWGQGLVEQIQSIQLEINKILWIIQRSFHLAGSFKIFLENGSKVVKEHLNNDVGAIVTYSGTKPEYVVPPIVAPEMYQHLQTLKNQGFEQAGVSQLSATSQKPAGLNSGKALREYNDIETERFMVVGQSFQNLFINMADLAVDEAKQIAEEEGSFSVISKGDKFLKEIDWKDVEMDKSDYVTQCYPVSSLPSDPAGRLQTIQEYMQAGLISPRQGRRLLDFPDLKQIEDLANSQEEVIHEAMEKIVEEGVYTAPEEFDDLPLARELALQYYADGKTNGLEEEKLDMIRTYLSQLDAFDGIVSPEPVQVQPQAAPMAQPQNDMIPNVPAVA